jgi:hypothetical protein
MPYIPLQQFVDRMMGVSRYEAPAQSPQQIQTQKIRDAIAHNETRGVAGDPYAFYRSSGSKAAGRALGKYQVTEGELKTYSGKYLGQNVTPQQFLASPAYQDNYMNGKIARLSAQGYTPHQIADIHRAGFTNSSAPGSTTYQNPAYVKSFNDAYMGTTGPPAVAPLTANQ